MGIVGCILSNAPIGGVEKIRQSKLTVQSFIECIFTMYKGFQAVSAFLPKSSTSCSESTEVSIFNRHFERFKKQNNS